VDRPGDSRTPERRDDQACPRVLVAEDHLVNRDMVARMLSHLGCEVETVDDGMQAYLACTRAHFDLVLMDCQMPRMDGFQAARSIREHERGNAPLHTPIVALTAHMAEHDRQTCLASGMDDFMTKPVAIAQLRMLLERWTGFRSPATTPVQLPLPAAISGELDPTALAALRALRRPGRPNLVMNLIVDYLETAPERVARLLVEMREASAASGGETAHGLKSISATLGARELAQTLARIEAVQRAGELSALQREIEPLTMQFAYARAGLATILESERTSEEAAT
jgi:two-component system sensor histidine kinase/response regulator